MKNIFLIFAVFLLVACSGQSSENNEEQIDVINNEVNEYSAEGIFSEQKIEPINLPSNVRVVVDSLYDGNTLNSIEEVTDMNGDIIYKINLSANQAVFDVVIDANGVLQEKSGK